MPPSLDIYGLTRHRDALTINRFIDRYVDRLKSDDRSDEELMIEPLPTLPRPASLDAFDWEPASTLTHIVERGLEYPRRAFTVYLSPIWESTDQAILSFTRDNQLVLGLSVDDEGKMEENEVNAKVLLKKIMEEFDCHAGIIVIETRPPASMAELLEMRGGPFTVLFTCHE